MEEIQKERAEFKLDKNIEKEFKDVEKIRQKNSELVTQIEQDPTLSSHYLQRQFDPRTKYDSEFIQLQKRLGKEFEKNAKKFVAEMESLRRECAENFE